MKKLAYLLIALALACNGHKVGSSIFIPAANYNLAGDVVGTTTANVVNQAAQGQFTFDSGTTPILANNGEILGLPNNSAFYAPTNKSIEIQGANILLNASGSAGYATLMVGGAYGVILRSTGFEYLLGEQHHTRINAGTASDAITTADYMILVEYAHVVTETLPDPTVQSGQTYCVKDASGNAGADNITIHDHAAETIDGATTKVLTVNYTGSCVTSDGTNWAVTSQVSIATVF